MLNFKRYCRIRKNEVFHIIIFAMVFLYFIALKLMGYIDISWTIILLPLLVGTVIWLLVKLAKIQLTKRRNK